MLRVHLINVPDKPRAKASGAAGAGAGGHPFCELFLLHDEQPEIERPKNKQPAGLLLPYFSADTCSLPCTCALIWACPV